MFNKESIGYVAVPELEEGERSSDDVSSGLLSSLKKTEKSTWRKSKPLVLTAAFALATLLLGICIGRVLPRNYDDLCTRHTSSYCEHIPPF
jgi:hypothetical protein